MVWRHPLGNMDQPINPEFEQEARLVEQARAGSERAFAALLARYQQPVFRLIFFLVGDEEEARGLARIALKHALLHMPRVPSGHSIRPWLLRVATLVAVDAVRERSESPQALLAALQLPPPPGPPRMVDADPTLRASRSGVPAIRRTSRPVDASIAAPGIDPGATVLARGDEIPIEIERELIRRLLAGLPDGDAELLALGVVGQVPTRDLAALAGTSQRSVRRRIARALILFQSRYQTVWQAALPGATTGAEIPLPAPDVTARASSRAGAVPGNSVGSLSEDALSQRAQQQLESLWMDQVPSITMTPSQPLRAPDLKIPPGVDMPPIEAQDTITTSHSSAMPPPIFELPPMIFADTGEARTLSGTISPFADAEREREEAIQILARSLPDTTLADAAPQDEPVEVSATPASDPASSQVRPRILPRFGPPIETVASNLLGEDAGVAIDAPLAESSAMPNPADVLPMLPSDVVEEQPEAVDEAEPANVAFSTALRSPQGETLAPDRALTETYGATSGVWIEVSDLDPVPTASLPDWLESPSIAPPSLEAAVPVSEAPPDELPVESAVSAISEQSVEGDTAVSSAVADFSAHEMPPESGALFEGDRTPDDQVAEEPVEADHAVQYRSIAEQVEEQETIATQTGESLTTDGLDEAIQAAMPEERASAALALGEAREEDPLGMPAAARDQWDLDRLVSGRGTIKSGDTIVVTPYSRADYMARHRPPRLDAADLSGLMGVTFIDDDLAESDDEALPVPPLPPMTLMRPMKAIPLNELAEDEPSSTPPADLGDLQAIIATVAEPVPPAPVPPPPEAQRPPDPPVVAPEPIVPKPSTRTPTRPVPRLKRDVEEPPPTW